MGFHSLSRTKHFSQAPMGNLPDQLSHVLKQILFRNAHKAISKNTSRQPEPSGGHSGTSAGPSAAAGGDLQQFAVQTLNMCMGRFMEQSAQGNTTGQITISPPAQSIAAPAAETEAPTKVEQQAAQARGCH